ncbi:MAG: hypothetical protein V3V78_01205 [Candidatus Woesearchaeota archaeon]
MKEPKYSTLDDLFKGFSDSQIEKLMENMTIFQPMDWCPSPCNICAYEANKKVGTVMGFEMIEELVKTFADNFNSNKPEDHAYEQLAYMGEDGESYFNILELHDEFLDHTRRIMTAMPKGAGELFLKILNTDFKHNPKMFVSRHLHNYGVVDPFLESVEASPEFVSKKDVEKILMVQIEYALQTDLGERKFILEEVMPIPLGAAKDVPVILKEGNLLYVFCQLKGVAVMPTGFYNYDPMNPSFHSLMESKITPENFNMQEKENYFSVLGYCIENGRSKMRTLKKK